LYFVLLNGILLNTRGLGVNPLDHRRRGEFPVIFIGASMRELGIFIDESGDFGSSSKATYYIVTFVLHDKSNSIDKLANTLQSNLYLAGFSVNNIHSGPLIRREVPFKGYSLDERRQILYTMLNFYNKCPIQHFSVIIEKDKYKGKIELAAAIGNKIREFLINHEEIFQRYSSIKIYYDNGQIELGAILSGIFSSRYNNVEIKQASPNEYRLLQVADFICTMELIHEKEKHGMLSQSEVQFFYKSKELKKTFFKSIEKKKLV